MKTVTGISITLIFILVFLLGYYESRGGVSSRSVAEIDDNDYVDDDNTGLEETLDASYIFQVARLLAIISVVVGLFRLAYPDHLRV